MAVTVTDAPDPVAARSQLTYTVTARNDGTGAATGVTLVDTLPDATSVSATSGCTRAGKGRGGGTLTCELGRLGAGESATVTIVVSPTRDATVTNTAVVRANEPDPDAADDTTTELTTVLAR